MKNKKLLIVGGVAGERLVRPGQGGYPKILKLLFLNGDHMFPLPTVGCPITLGM